MDTLPRFGLLHQLRRNPACGHLVLLGEPSQRRLVPGAGKCDSRTEEGQSFAQLRRIVVEQHLEQLRHGIERGAAAHCGKNVDSACQPGSQSGASRLALGKPLEALASFLYPPEPGQESRKARRAIVQPGWLLRSGGVAVVDVEEFQAALVAVEAGGVVLALD